jgi:UDP-glucose 4-epimerase
VSDLVRAHCDALAYLRGGGGVSATLNCGYGRGFSVLEVIETVKRVSGADFEVAFAGRRAGDPAQIVAASDRARLCSNGSRFSTTCEPSCATRWHGSASF